MIAAILALSPAALAAAPSPETDNLRACRKIDDDTARAKCYDIVVDSQEKPVSVATHKQSPPTPSNAAVEILAKAPPANPNSYLDQQWCVPGDPGCVTSNGSHLHWLKIRSYKPSYFLFHYQPSPNQTPFNKSTEFEISGQEGNFDRDELKFQISAKTLILPFANGKAGFWLAYTQQSLWQAFNSKLSSPFRETNYEPEAILSLLNPYSSADSTRPLQLRYLNLGFVHQSNGRGQAGLSRSWNRLYAQFNFENVQHEFTLMIRPWWRIPEGRSSDDNPDLENYLGYGDIVAVKQLTDNISLSVMLRDNLSTSTNRGAIQADLSIWTPCKFCHLGPLDWHIQVFSGYGESLIDYKHRQTTVGVGVDLVRWP